MVAHHNRWDTDRLATEWETRRTSVLQTERGKSLAAAIELPLASAMFQALGPDARALLGVAALFPQGINENNLDWLFPTISSGTNVLDRFCILSLIYWSNGFITMLAPLRDYLSPKDPMSSSLLCTTREHYFTRMSIVIDPSGPSLGESQWITSEDVNVKHLLDIFTTSDPNSDNVWDTYTNFIRHLAWHKKRLIILKPKIEGLPDDHSCKPGCLIQLSQLLCSVGNHAECKRLLTHALKLCREREDDYVVAQILGCLSDTNWLMGHLEEGMQQAEEALEIFESLGDIAGQAQCSIVLARLLRQDEQLDAAEVAASHAISLIPQKGEQYLVCESHRVLAQIHRSKGETEKAIHHFELAVGIGSSFDWHNLLFWIHYDLGLLFCGEGRFDDAHAHIEHAKSHTVDHSAYNLGRAMELQAVVWHKQHRLEEAGSEALRATDVYEKLGAAKDVEECRKLLQEIQEELDSPATSGQSTFNCKIL